MAEPLPRIYLLQGDDEFAISQSLKELEARFIDPAYAALNQASLDGRSAGLDELLSVASAMPFLAQYRLVTLTYASTKYNRKDTASDDEAGEDDDNKIDRGKDQDKPLREKFLAALDGLPETTILILVEYLPEDKRKYKGQWLEKWFRKAEAAGKPVQVDICMLPKGAEITSRILEMTKQAGGKITPRAAAELASLIGSEPRLARQEIEKLLAYVNYQRAVELDDVQAVTADTAEGNVFAMVDALAQQQGQRAMSMLQRLLEQENPVIMFGMVVRQFRLLIAARDVLDRGAGESEMVKKMKLHPYVASKSISQARRFRMADLETVYHRLLDLDEGVKTSQLTVELALETLVASFTAPQAVR